MKQNTKHYYLGETDPALFIHQNKTHRSVSEAFRDADYATPIWRCETDWDRSKPILACILALIGAGGIIYLFFEGFISWLVS